MVRKKFNPMQSKHWQAIALLFAITGSMAGYTLCHAYPKKGFVTITNHTKHPLTDVALIYNGDKDKVAWIGTIPAKDSFTLPINYANIHEGSLSVVYTLEGNQLSTAPFGYVAAYNKEHYRVDIRQ